MKFFGTGFFSRAYNKRALLWGNVLNTACIVRAFQALGQGQLADAESKFTSALSRSSSDHRAYIGLARLALLRDDLDTALDNWDKAIFHLPSWRTHLPGDLDPLMAKAECLLQMYRFEEVRQLSPQLLRERPNDEKPYSLPGRADMREGRYTSALGHWRAMRAVFPHSTAAIIGQINCLIDSGDFNGAERLLVSACEEWPGNTELTLLKARLALKSGNPKPARDLLQALRTEVPDHIAVYAFLRQALLELCDLEELERYINLAPLEIRLSEQFADEVLAPFYIETRNWEDYRLCLQRFSGKSLSPRLAHITARFYLHRHEFENLVNFLTPVIHQFPYHFPLYRFLLRAYHQTNRYDKLRILKKAMVSRFGKAICYPLFIDLGARFIDDDFHAVFQWLLENSAFRKTHMPQLLDSLLIGDSDRELMSLVHDMSGKLPALEQIRVLGIECQSKDQELLEQSNYQQIPWKRLKMNLENLKKDVSRAANSSFTDTGVDRASQNYYTHYVQTLGEYDSSHLFTRESFFDAACVMEKLLSRVTCGTPTSFIRLGDGEGNYLPYREEYSQCAKQDQEAMQHVWWGRTLLSGGESGSVSAQLLVAIDNADFVGVPPPWRVVKELFNQGRLDLSRQYTRGNAAIIDYFSSHHVGRRKVVTSSAIANDLSRWDLYRSLFSIVDSISFISCHQLQKFLASNYGVKSRQRHMIPTEHAFGSMWRRENLSSQAPEAEGSVQSIYPDVFKEIMEKIAPLPGETYLVAAGFLGKIFCDVIKRRGGIGIDIGSTADYWMGYETRRYKMNKFAFDASATSLSRENLVRFLYEENKTSAI